MKFALLSEEIRNKIKVNSETGCWEWIGYITGYGYGEIKVRGKKYKAHRFVWAKLVGAPHVGPLDHTCARRPGADPIWARRCVYPVHLDPVTIKVNVLLGEGPSARNARKAFCPKGHPLSGLNLYLAPSGKRQCRECRKEHSRSYYKRHVDVVKERGRLYYELNSEIRKEYAKTRRASMSEEQRAACLAGMRDRRQINAEHLREYERIRNADPHRREMRRKRDTRRRIHATYRLSIPADAAQTVFVG